MGMFRFEVSDHLTSDAARIRQEVFVEEQGFQVEFDDKDDLAIHIVLYDDDAPVAVCRVIPEKDGGACSIGRVAVVPDHRGMNLGAEIMAEAERQAAARGWTVVGVSAQVRARGFYERCGYTAHGDVYMDEFCPHIAMTKVLDKSSL